MNLFLQAAYKVQPDDTISCYDIFKDFIFPSLILIATIVASIWLAKKEFLRQVEIDENSKKDLDNSIKEIIVYSLGREEKNLIEIIKSLKELEDLTIDNFSSKQKIIYEAYFVDSILAVDLININRLLKPYSKINNDFNVVHLITTLNTLKVNFLKLEKVQNEFFQKYEELATALTLEAFKRTSLIISKSTGLQEEKENIVDEIHSTSLKKILKLMNDNKDQNTFKSDFSIHIELTQELNNAIDFSQNTHLIHSPLYLVNVEIDTISSRIKSCIFNFKSEVQNIEFQLSTLKFIVNLYHETLKGSSK